MKGVKGVKGVKAVRVGHSHTGDEEEHKRPAEATVSFMESI